MRPLHEYFERVVCINLDRRPDRWERLQGHLRDVGWPFRACERFRAVDGTLARPPDWWRAGAGAWGCFQSHLRVIERAVMDGVSSVLVLEDDVCFPPDFHERVARFVSEVPDDWQQVYLGGQHLHQNVQPPVQISPAVCVPYNVNRTHAYAIRGEFLPTVYRWLCDYVAHAERPQQHIDHRLGRLHETRQYRVYAPVEWIAGQDSGRSDVSHGVLPARFWASQAPHEHELPGVVAIIGLHRSGSSCLAGVLHKLGVHMGDRLIGCEPTGGFEAVGLARVCEAAYPFPTTELRVPEAALRERLAAHLRYVRAAAHRRGTIAGAKYPHLCAMGEFLGDICGDKLRVIHIDRPLDASIRSLQARSRRSRGHLRVSDRAAEEVQRWLWDRKRRFLDTVDHLTVQYSRLLDDPATEVERVISYLGIAPSDAQRSAAVRHVSPELCHHSA